MIRVLHLIDSFDLGGAQTVLLEYLRHRDRHRFHLEAATMHGRGVFWEALAETDTPLHSLSPQKWPPAYLWELPQLLERGHFDIVHCHLFGSNWIGQPLARWAGVPVVIGHDHCNDAARADNLVATLIDRSINQTSSHLLSVSRSITEFLTHIEGLDPEKITTLPNPVDTRRFLPATPEAQRAAREKIGLPEHGFIVGGVGRLTRQKNFHRFIEIAAAVRQAAPSMQFCLAGHGPEETALRSHNQTLGNPVQFLGFQADTISLYQALDVVLLTSDYEGMPMTILEAMSAAVPVVASRVDGLSEVIQTGTDGLLVAPEDRTGFVQALLGLFQDDAKRQALGRSAREKMLGSFDSRHYARQLESIYCQQLAIAKPPKIGILPQHS